MSVFNFVLLAATGTGTEDVGVFGSSISFIVIMAVMLLAMYFIMWRPNKKKEKQAQEMRNSIEVGDEVTTIGGIVGRVVSMKEDTYVLETAGERSRLRFRRWAIQDVNKLNLEPAADSSEALKEKAAAEKSKGKK